MIHKWWTSKSFVVAVVIASLACVAVVVAIGLARPDPVSSAALGPDWQCSRLAFVWTTCIRLKQAEAAEVRVAKKKEPGCARQRS
jgi:hypothetical protein